MNRAPLATHGTRVLTPAAFRRALEVTERSQVCEVIEARLRADRGRPTEISVKALVFGLFALGAQQHHRMHLIEVARLLNSLNPEQRRRLDCHRRWDSDQTYDRVDRLFNRVINSLTDSALADLVQNVIDASIDGDLPRSGSVAVDGTDLQTWGALPGDCEDVELDGPATKDLEEEGLVQPKRARRVRRRAVPLGIGPDGRKVYTKDPDARGGWRTATASRPSGPYIGYEAHIVAQIRDVRSSNLADKVTFGEDVPQLIVGLAVTPAGSHRAAAITPTLLNLKAAAHNALREVVWDRGYSMARPENGYFPLRSAGINLIFDLTDSERGRRPFKTPDFLIDGQLYSRHMPEELRQTVSPRPNRSMSREDRIEWERKHNLRARWRLTRHAIDTDGTTRWRCPFHSGLLRSRSFPHTIRGRANAPVVPVDADRCCDGILSVAPVELPKWQPYTYGTTAWMRAYGRRNIVESVNAALQNQFIDLERGYLRVFGLKKVTLLLAFAAAGYNQDRGQSWRRRHEGRGPERKPRRAGTYRTMGLVGPIPNSDAVKRQEPPP